jgi:hypothetical protein
MSTEQTIPEIEWLERIFAEPDTRPLSASDLAAANRKHDERESHSQGTAFTKGRPIVAGDRKVKALTKLSSACLTGTEIKHRQANRNTNYDFWQELRERCSYFFEALIISGSL